MEAHVVAEARATRSVSAGTALDDLSKRIIEALQLDGRRSYASIAKDVGLSEAAVRQRVQRLVETGAMQIVAVTDPLQVGFNRQAMIGVECSGDPVALADRIAELRAVDYVVVTAGRFDLLVEVVCADDEELLDLVSRQIRSLPEVERSEIFVYLKLVKQHYDWGTR